MLAILPDKLKAEIAIHVHYDTLKRVKIFQVCYFCTGIYHNGTVAVLFKGYYYLTGNKFSFRVPNSRSKKITGVHFNSRANTKNSPELFKGH